MACYLLYVILNIVFVLTLCQGDIPLGAGLVVIEATCEMRVTGCSSPPCRFYCPANCRSESRTQIFSQDSKPCREARYLLSAENAVDIFIDDAGTISLATSIHTMSLARRNSQPFCVGDLSLANDASICIITCSLPDYECPRRFKQRCACPWNKPILKDVDNGICVNSIRECPPYNTYILPKDGLSTFKFIKEPEDLVKKRGDKIRLHCTVSGDTNYQYYWYKSQSLAMGSHSILKSKDGFLQQTGNPYYDINSVQPSDSGFYHCIVRTGDSVNSKDAKYSLVSNTGYLRVEYFDRPALGDPVILTTQEEALQTVLPCELPKSEPPVEATWYKGDEVVSDLRMFVVPQAQKADEEIRPGSLYIMMATTSDADLYTCKITYAGVSYEVTKVSLEVTGFIGQPNSAPEIVVEVPGRARVGETASFFCAGVGNPVPTVSWSQEDNTRIDISDTVGLSDFNRKLTIANVQPDMDRAYACTVYSSDRNKRKTLLYLSIMPSSYQINFVQTPSSQVIRPNVYTPFTLQCAITVDPIVEAPVMYWLKNGASLDMKPGISRIRTETLETTKNGTTIRNSTLIFDTPNESDKGVYQCIVENKEQMRQATAYIDVIKPDMYDVYYPQDYKVVTERMKIGDAADYCANQWSPRGTLVTITNRNESETVFRLLIEEGLTASWIGLTSENVLQTRGVWNWQAGNVPKDFSYWYKDNPDNASGNETYAIMDVTKAGHWLDMGNDEMYPFVCSRYTAQCPSITQFFNNSAEPILSPLETPDTYYEVGKVLTITCADKKKRADVQQRVECRPSGQFHPSVIPCPMRSRAGHVTATLQTVLGVLLLFLLVR